MKHLKLYLVLLIALVIDIAYLLKPHAMWWDASVYLGMGHYIYSLGAIGIWEPIRPLVWPILLGFFWKIGLNDAAAGYLLGILFSLGSVAMAYLICKKMHGEEAGFIAALILAFTPVFFESVFRNMTELPSVFFALLAVYLFISKKPFWAGAVAGISFLTKFPNGIVIAVLLIASIRDFKKLFRVGLGAAVFVLPYFAFNYFMYGAVFSVIYEADAIVKNAGTWLFSGPVYYYLVGVLKENPLYLLSIAGIYACIRSRKYLVPALGILFFAYFSYHVHKEMRFGLLMLPYFAILAAVGIKRVFRQGWAFWAILAVTGIVFATHLPSEWPIPDAREGYLHYIEGETVTGEVLTADPLVNLYSSKAVIPMYYPVFNAGLASKWISYANENYASISYVFLDTCSGGVICNPGEAGCEAKKWELIALLKEKFRTGYYAKQDSCEYWVFEEKKNDSSKV